LVKLKILKSTRLVINTNLEISFLVIKCIRFQGSSFILTLNEGNLFAEGFLFRIELCYFKKLQMLVLFLDPKDNERFFVKFCFDPHLETTLKVLF
jgi:hypothetical protein